MSDYVDDAHALVTLAKSAAAVGAVLPARAQRRRRGFLRLHARTPGGAGGLHLRELRVPGLRAGPRARRRQGAEPRRAARARAEPEDRGLLARSGGGAGDARRSADRGRIAADQHRRRARPRRRAAEAGVPAHHAAGADPARHRGQGHATGRQPVLLRDGGLERQDAEAVRRPRPRPAQRPRPGRRHGRHRRAGSRRACPRRKDCNEKRRGDHGHVHDSGRRHHLLQGLGTGRRPHRRAQPRLAAQRGQLGEPGVPSRRQRLPGRQPRPARPRPLVAAVGRQRHGPLRRRPGAALRAPRSARRLAHRLLDRRRRGGSLRRTPRDGPHRVARPDLGGAAADAAHGGESWRAAASTSSTGCARGAWSIDRSCTATSPAGRSSGSTDPARARRRG